MCKKDNELELVCGVARSADEKVIIVIQSFTKQ